MERGIPSNSYTFKPFFARYLPQLVGNPISWLSRNGHSRGTLGQSADLKPGPDFWLVTQDQRTSTFFKDIESPALVMQMRAVPMMPGMPTPMRPPRTQSTMKSLSIHEPHNLNFKIFAHKSQTPSTSSIATASMAMSDRPMSVIPKPLNLNKPLPVPRVSWDIDEAHVAEEQDRETDDTTSSSSANIMSVYQLVPYEDGHISVHRTKERDRGT